MANYYNPYNFYSQYPVQAAPAANPGYTPVQMQQSQAVPPQPQLKAMEWVEGEVAAKAYQMPPGWPPNQPIPLWDSTDTNIFMKSWGPMGIPNPIQKLHYEMSEQQPQPMLQSGTESPSHASYATKDDIEGLRAEFASMKELLANSRKNQNVSNAPNNRGGMNNA